MYCKNCGHQIEKLEQGQEFCPKCGSKIVYSGNKSKWLLILSIIFWLLCIGIVCGILGFVGFMNIEMNGRSMEDALHDGDRLTVGKFSYAFKDPKRFDIIVFKPKGSPEELYVKRIIGIPGETVQIDDAGNIFIDGELLEENYGKETIMDPGGATEPIMLGDDEYFVLGDNRNNSRDSRDREHVGTVSRDAIIGKVLF